MRRAGHACNPPCDGRLTAQRAGDFLWCAGRGYIVVGAPLKRDGAPFVWVECPWCGGDLDEPHQGEEE
jgi:hypothetical protein